MKNVLIIDIDTDREQVVQIGKPNGGDLPKNKEEAEKSVKKDIACLTEGLVSMIQLANDSGYKTSEDSINDLITHMERAFSEEPSVKVKSIKKIENE